MDARWPTMVPRWAFLRPWKLSTSLVRASNAVRGIMSTRFGISSGHVQNNIQNGSFVDAQTRVGVPRKPLARVFWVSFLRIVFQI